MVTLCKRGFAFMVARGAGSHLLLRIDHDVANPLETATEREFLDHLDLIYSPETVLRGGDDPFAETTTRQVLFAVREVAASDEASAESALLWLREEVPNFWANRKTAHILAGPVESMAG